MSFLSYPTVLMPFTRALQLYMATEKITYKHNMKNDFAVKTRLTPEYAQAIQLLTQKKELQAHLREVDRRLRELEHVTEGIISLAREDINFKSRENIPTYGDIGR